MLLRLTQGVKVRGSYAVFSDQMGVSCDGPHFGFVKWVGHVSRVRGILAATVPLGPSGPIFAIVLFFVLGVSVRHAALLHFQAWIGRLLLAHVPVHCRASLPELGNPCGGRRLDTEPNRWS